MIKKIYKFTVFILAFISTNVLAVNNNYSNAFEIAKSDYEYYGFKPSSKIGSSNEIYSECVTFLMDSKKNPNLLKVPASEHKAYQIACAKQYYTVDQNKILEGKSAINNCKDEVVVWKQGIHECNGALVASRHNTKQPAFAIQTDLNQRMANPVAFEGKAYYKCNNGIWEYISGVCARKPEYNVKEDPVNCKGLWIEGDWSSCSNGTRIKQDQFKITQEAINNGESCNFDHGTIRTATQSCEEECKFEWSEPTFDTCQIDGFTTRSKTYNLISGSCPFEDGEVLTDTVPCQNCNGNWIYDDWSQCVEGRKERLRTFKITSPASNGGASCQYEDGYKQMLWMQCTNDPIYDCDPQDVEAPFTRKPSSPTPDPVVRITEGKDDGGIFALHEDGTSKCGSLPYFAQNQRGMYSYDAELQCVYDGTWKVNKSECNLDTWYTACQAQRVYLPSGNIYSLRFTTAGQTTYAFGNCDLKATCSRDTGRFINMVEFNCDNKYMN